MIMFTLYLAEVLQCQLTVRGSTYCLTRKHYPDSEPTSLCSFSLMPRAQRRSNTYQFYSLWFDPNGVRTNDRPHSMRARQPLHHRCGSTPLKNQRHNPIESNEKGKKRFKSVNLVPTKWYFLFRYAYLCLPYLVWNKTVERLRRCHIFDIRISLLAIGVSVH